NCRIWATENPLETQPVPLYPAKVTVWCGFTASFIIGPYFFEETGALGPVTITVTGQRSWPSRSPDLNPCDFWLWGYLKDVVFSTPIAHLAELKARIAQHILNVSPETLRSVVEHAVSRFQLVAENDGQHIEHVLHQSRVLTSSRV
ncbi:hypothetical protein AVEN_208727-1, partial [Araneus ventricosus]